MTRTYGERVDDRLEAGYRELKRFGKTQSKMVGDEVQLQGRYHQRKAKKYKPGVERRGLRS